jgi:FKBP-type peptidyl-prolyl cis-trans isomerase
MKRIGMKVGLAMFALGAAIAMGFTYGSKKGQKMQKTPSGLQYEIIAEGSGAQPQKGQQVSVHYTGWLSTGSKDTPFDSSKKRGTPFTFPVGVGYVIKGWDEGVMLMKVGSTYRFYIPANLGYGAQGAGRVIPPNADLVFDVQLLSVS